MVKVKTFGTFRLDTGVRELELEAHSVKELLRAAEREFKRLSPDSAVDMRALRGCIVSVNGVQVKPSHTLCDGDIVWLMPAVAGG